MDEKTPTQCFFRLFQRRQCFGQLVFTLILDRLRFRGGFVGHGFVSSHDFLPCFDFRRLLFDTNLRKARHTSPRSQRMSATNHQILHHDRRLLQSRLQLRQLLLHGVDGDTGIVQLLETIQIIILQRLNFISFRSQQI